MPLLRKKPFKLAVQSDFSKNFGPVNISACLNWTARPPSQLVKVFNCHSGFFFFLNCSVVYFLFTCVLACCNYPTSPKRQASVLTFSQKGFLPQFWILSLGPNKAAPNHDANSTMLSAFLSTHKMQIGVLDVLWNI